MPDYVIKTTFKGADKLTPILKRMGIAVEKTGDRASKAFKRASKQASVFRGVLKGIIAAGIIRRGAMIASQAVRGLAEEFVEFDVAITKAVTRLPGQLDRTSKEFQQLSKAARIEAAKTEFTAGQTAAAVEQLALAGFKANEVLGLLPGTLQLATNAGVDVADATRMAVKSLGAFGMRAGTAAEKQRNLTRVNDVFSRAISSATLDIETMFETLKFAGPAMFAAGQDIETFGAAAELMADRAIDASIAGTSLRMAFVRMAKPPKEARVELKRLGIEIAKDGVFRDFADILEDLEKKTANMGNQQRLATISTIFGVRAQGGMNALLQAGSKEFRKYRKELENAGGASKKMADTIRTSIGVRLKILRSALIELGFKFVTAFTGKAGKGLDDLVARVRKFDMKPVVQGVKDAVKFTKEFWAAIKPFRDFLPVVIGMWAAYKAMLIAVTVVQAAQFFVKLAGAMKAASAAQWLLNIAMAANPVGLVAIAIVGLVAALAILITKNDEVVSEWEVGFARMHQTLIRYKVNALKMIQTIVNGIIDTFTKLPASVLKFFGIDVTPIIPKVKFDFTEEEQKLAQIEKQIADMRAEAAGLGVARGAAGIRGGRVPTAAEKATSLEAVLERQRERHAMTRAAMMAGAGVTEPKAPEVMAPGGGQFKFIFENIPPGLKLAEQKTTGSTDISLEGLGQQ